MTLPFMRYPTLLNTLYGRLSVVFLLVLLVLGTVVFQLSQRNAHRYFQEFTQRLNSPVAMYVAEHLATVNNAGLDANQLASIAHHVTMLNPGVEIYLLDLNGHILDQSIASERLQRQSVRLKPIEQFLAGDTQFPLVGDDPKDRSQSMIFSVHPLIHDSQRMGYIYAILSGQNYRQMYAQIRRDYRINTLLPTIGSSIVLAALAGLIVFGMLTRRLRTLTANVYRQPFVDGGSEQRGRVAGKASGDEIDALNLAWESITEKLQNRNTELAQADKSYREVVGNISHDLRTPLTVQQGYLETVAMRPNLSADTRAEYLNVALKQGTRLQRLVKDLFDLANLEAPTIKLHAEPFSIADLASDCLQSLDRETDQRGVGSAIAQWPDSVAMGALPGWLGSADTCLSPAKDVWVNADIRLVERVIENLYCNALPFTPAHGKIAVLVGESGSLCRVAVVDTGRGINAEDLPHVFDRQFSHRDPITQSKDHAGLGLAIVQRIIELHGQQVQVASTPGIGTAVVFTLPLAKTVAPRPVEVEEQLT